MDSIKQYMVSRPDNGEDYAIIAAVHSSSKIIEPEMEHLVSCCVYLAESMKRMIRWDTVANTHTLFSPASLLVRWRWVQSILIDPTTWFWLSRLQRAATRGTTTVRQDSVRRA